MNSISNQLAQLLHVFFKNCPFFQRYETPELVLHLSSYCITMMIFLKTDVGCLTHLFLQFVLVKILFILLRIHFQHQCYLLCPLLLFFSRFFEHFGRYLFHIFSFPPMSPTPDQVFTFDPSHHR